MVNGALPGQSEAYRATNAARCSTRGGHERLQLAQQGDPEIETRIAQYEMVIACKPASPKPWTWPERLKILCACHGPE